MKIEELIQKAVREEVDASLSPIIEKIDRVIALIENKDELITNKKAQQLLGVSYGSIMRMVESGDLKQYPRGTTLKFSLKEVNALKRVREIKDLEAA